MASSHRIGLRYISLPSGVVMIKAGEGWVYAPAGHVPITERVFSGATEIPDIYIPGTVNVGAAHELPIMGRGFSGATEIPDIYIPGKVNVVATVSPIHGSGFGGAVEV